jgi:hypothetical protein
VTTDGSKAIEICTVHVVLAAKAAREPDECVIFVCELCHGPERTPEQEGTMTKNRIIGAIAALSLLAVPAVAAAHSSGDDHGHKARHHHHHKHHGKKAKTREVTGSATGTIASFANGELTITLPSGKSFTADVKRRTVILCKSLPVVPAASTARHGDDDGNSGSGRAGRDDGPNHDAGDDHGSDQPATTTAPASTTTPSTTVPPTTDDRGNDDHNNRDGARCGTDALVAGTSVATAKLSLKGGNAVWKKVVLLK